MFLIFTLRRPDIFPVTDLGVQKGFQIYYDLDELPSIDMMNEKSENWKPYRTIMSLYLWLANQRYKDIIVLYGFQFSDFSFIISIEGNSSRS